MVSLKPFRFTTRVRFIDTDSSGRIHYTAMFRYFEAAETEFMRALGITYTLRSYAFPRVHVECDFMAAIIHDDELEIETTLAAIGRSSIKMSFRTLKAGSLAAKGAVVIACMDRESQCSTPIPDPLRSKLEAALYVPNG
jgi:acyl-CoA thioester hydrolase